MKKKPTLEETETEMLNTGLPKSLIKRVLNSTHKCNTLVVTE